MADEIVRCADCNKKIQKGEETPYERTVNNIILCKDCIDRRKSFERRGSTD